MFGSVIEVVGVLRAGELGELPDARIEEEFDELHRLVELLEVERLRRLAEIDRRNLFQRDGHLSAVSWLAARYRVPRGAAAEQVRSARALEQMPAARAALGAGEVSLGAAKMLAAARQVDPEAFSRSEPVLVDAARRHSTADLRRVLGFWQERVRQERLEAGGFVKARGLHASVTFAGMVRVDADLDPETGEALLAAINAVMDAEARSGEEDPRTPAQKRADALGEVCRGWLGSCRTAVGRGRAPAHDGKGRCWRSRRQGSRRA